MARCAALPASVAQPEACVPAQIINDRTHFSWSAHVGRHRYAHVAYPGVVHVPHERAATQARSHVGAASNGNGAGPASQPVAAAAPAPAAVSSAQPFAAPVAEALPTPAPAAHERAAQGHAAHAAAPSGMPYLAPAPAQAVPPASHAAAPAGGGLVVGGIRAGQPA